MDLLEARGENRRHPWELSRAKAVEQIVRRYDGGAVTSILDFGCGDGFTGRFLLDRLGAGALVGVDPHLTDAQRSSLTQGDERIRLFRDQAEVPARQFDLMLLCDVIEHVPDDIALVEPLARRFLATGGRLVVTVPAFQALFSAHDVALKHYRRYWLPELESVLRRSGLRVPGAGISSARSAPARGSAFERAPPLADEGIRIGAGKREASTALFASSRSTIRCSCGSPSSASVLA
jgi:SAM-dependent methyltransferase